MYEKKPGHKCAALGRCRECDYFDGKKVLAVLETWARKIDPYTCPATKGDGDDCNKFWSNVISSCSTT